MQTGGDECELLRKEHTGGSVCKWIRCVLLTGLSERSGRSSSHHRSTRSASVCSIRCGSTGGSVCSKARPSARDLLSDERLDLIAEGHTSLRLARRRRSTQQWCVLCWGWLACWVRSLNGAWLGHARCGQCGTRRIGRGRTQSCWRYSQSRSTYSKIQNIKLME